MHSIRFNIDLGHVGRCAALVCAVSCAPTHAAVSGSAQVNWQTLAIHITDTNPNDGIAAGAAWLWQRTSASSFVDGTGFLPESAFAFDWTSAGGYTASRPDFSTQTAFDAIGLSVTASATAGPVIASRVYREGRLQFIGQGRIEASVLVHAEVAASADQQAARAYADANLLFADSSWNALSDVAYARADLTNGGLMSETLKAALEFHDGDQAQLLTQPGVVLAPVPEPAGWALLAGGLIALVGWSSRHRQRRRDSVAAAVVV